jgi:hypothetical protein
VIPEIGPLETPLDAEIEAEKARRAKDEAEKVAEQPTSTEKKPETKTAETTRQLLIGEDQKWRKRKNRAGQKLANLGNEVRAAPNGKIAQEIAKGLPDLEERLREVREESRRALIDILAVDNPSIVGTKVNLVDVKLSPERMSEYTRAFDDFSRLVSSNVFEGKAVPVNIEFGIRSYHASGTVHVNKNGGGSVLVHELGHVVEYRNKEVLKKSLAFRDSRTVGEEWQKLSRLAPTSGYGEDERAKPDQFLDVYMGKDYERRATEILSTGIEMMYRDPLRLAKNDPEYFDFIFDVVRGR